MSFTTPAPVLNQDDLSGVADFNADGQNDVVFHNRTTGATSFRMMDASNQAQIGATVALSGHADQGTDWSIAAVADLNADNKPDILWRNAVTLKLQIWLMNGTAYASTITPSPDEAPDANWNIVAAADLGHCISTDQGCVPSADGNTDILWYTAQARASCCGTGMQTSSASAATSPLPPTLAPTRGRALPSATTTQGTRKTSSGATPATGNSSFGIWTWQGPAHPVRSPVPTHLRRTRQIGPSSGRVRIA